MTIKKGDLVMVVKPTPCCGRLDNIGKVFQVGEVRNNTGICVYCGHSTTALRAILNHKSAILSIRLIKLNPPSDEETTQQTKEMEKQS